VFDIFRHVVPPLVLFVLSVVILAALGNRTFYPLLAPKWDKPSSVVYKFLIWVSLFLAGISTPSLICFVYFLVWITLFLAKGVFRKTLSMKRKAYFFLSTNC